MNKAILNPLLDEVIVSKIYSIHEHKVMLDKDLAEQYTVQKIGDKNLPKNSIKHLKSGRILLPSTKA
jgi:hypothetical protein